MKAFVWSNEEKGAKYDILDIPAELVDDAKAAHEKLVEAVSAIDARGTVVGMSIRLCSSRSGMNSRPSFVEAT